MVYHTEARTGVPLRRSPPSRAASTGSSSTKTQPKYTKPYSMNTVQESFEMGVLLVPSCKDTGRDSQGHEGLGSPEPPPSPARAQESDSQQPAAQRGKARG